MAKTVPVLSHLPGFRWVYPQKAPQTIHPFSSRYATDGIVAISRTQAENISKGKLTLYNAVKRVTRAKYTQHKNWKVAHESYIFDSWQNAQIFLHYVPDNRFVFISMFGLISEQYDQESGGQSEWRTTGNTIQSRQAYLPQYISRNEERERKFFTLPAEAINITIY